MGILDTLTARLGQDVSAVRYGALPSATAAENTTAIQAAINTAAAAGGGVVTIPPGTYSVNGPIVISSNRVRLSGAGQETTTLSQANANVNLLEFRNASGPDVYHRYSGVSGMSLINLSANATSGAMIRCERPRNFLIDDMSIIGGFKGIEALSPGLPLIIQNSYIGYTGFTSAPGGESSGIHIGRMETTEADPNGLLDSADGNYYAVGYSTYISNVEIWGGGEYARQFGLLVNHIDGLLVSNSHFGRSEFAEVAFKALQPNMICQNVQFSNCQFDSLLSVATISGDYGVRYMEDGLASRLMRDHSFANCGILEAAKDGVSIVEEVKNFSWTGGYIKKVGDWGFRVNDAGAEVLISGATIRDTNEAATGAGYILGIAGRLDVRDARCTGSGVGVGISCGASSSASVIGCDVAATTPIQLAGTVRGNANNSNGSAPILLPEYADDAAAATGGVPVGGQYRTGSTIKVRVA